MTSSPEWDKMLRGEWYNAGCEILQANRVRCKKACEEFNASNCASRREKVRLWRNIVGDARILPPQLPDAKDDEAQFDETDPYVDGPISIDHGLNFKVGKGSFLNFNALVLDTCLITIGENVLFGPNVSLYGAIHPVDPAERRGLKGPEAGKEIHIEDDVWVGAGASILGGVRVGRGSTVGACSVVTKDVPAFYFVAGNPARVIRKIKTTMNLEVEGKET
ncbi:acetyltransferase CysE/LacA/LpxA/NodL family [Penicillium manginii]|uniref:acetyltransferase CysE/LacA/LpxA/NodL family n=1 Tax=Penicillium manginii TaxID=203109 RepID=UPI0025467D46|nr:acetyltransferase CysE/LacA/LpxA/NodL family [Penicillium manginii]KAJ5739523.1 acetyltransferase CysE/LacA/LpxA/NodL family [Penicillium manginii]